MTDRDDHSGDALPYLGAPLPDRLIAKQREMIEESRRLFAFEPEMTASQFLLQERIAAASRAYAEKVSDGLATFLAANPGRTPVLRTWYDEETKTLKATWEALQ